MRYWAYMADEGIVVRAAESRDEFLSPADWFEVPNITHHANANGIQAMDAGKRMVFRPQDQSFRQLAGLMGTA